MREERMYVHVQRGCRSYSAKKVVHKMIIV